MGSAVLLLSSIISYGQNDNSTVEDKSNGVVYSIVNTKVEKTTTEVNTETKVLELNMDFTHDFTKLGYGMCSFDHKATLHTSVVNKIQNANSVEVKPVSFTSSNPVIQQYNVELSLKSDTNIVATPSVFALSGDNKKEYYNSSKKLLAQNVTQSFKTNVSYANVTIKSLREYMTIVNNSKKSSQSKDICVGNETRTILFIPFNVNVTESLESYAEANKDHLDDISVAIQEGNLSYYGFVINDIIEESDTTNRVYDCDGYTPKVLPYGLDMSNVTSLTIGQGVEEIEPGAFMNSKIAKFEVKNNKNFSTSDNGLFIYNGDKTCLISASAAVNCCLALPKTVVAAFPGSTALVQKNARIVAYHEIDKASLMFNNLNGISNARKVESANDESEEDEETIYFFTDISSVHTVIEFPNEYSQYLSLSPLGYEPVAVTIKRNYYFNEENLNSLLAELAQRDFANGVCYIDCRKGKFPTNIKLSKISIPESLNKNLLIYLPSVTIEGSHANVICDGHCSELNLTRDSKYGFYNIIDFTADKVIVNSAAMSKNYVNFCFPFDAETITLTNGTTTQTGNINDLLRVCYYKNYDDGTLNYTINTTEKLVANHPYLINCRNAGDVKFTQMIVENTSVKATANADLNYPPSTTESDGWFMGGTYIAAVPNAESTDYFYGMLSNIFTKATNGKTTFKPFSAFMVCTDKEKAPGNARVCLQETEMQDIVANSIEDLADASEMAVSTSNGTISIFTTETVYVNITSVAGNKVFSGNVNGTETFEVNKGVYIVNGKKYFVK